MVMPNDPPPPVPVDSAQRGMKHWTIIGVGAAVEQFEGDFPDHSSWRARKLTTPRPATMT